eukprot:sb/3462283/
MPDLLRPLRERERERQRETERERDREIDRERQRDRSSTPDFETGARVLNGPAIIPRQCLPQCHPDRRGRGLSLQSSHTPSSGLFSLTEWFYTYSHFLTRYDRAVLEILYSYPRPPGAVVDEVIRQIGGDKESLHFRRGAIWFTCVFLPYALPSLITLASGGAQIGRIFCRVKSTGKNHGKSQERARKMSITIVILTVVFFICNTTYVKVVSMDAFWMEMNESITNNFILLVSSNHLMYLNTGQLSFHVSAFLNVILTVVRSIMLFIPLCQVRRTWIVTAIIAYSLLWAILILTEWFYTYSHFLTRYDRAVLEILYSYPRPPGAVVDEVIRQIGGDKESLHFRRGAIWFTCVFLPYALPSLITLASGGAQIGRIFCRVKSTGKNHGKSQERARKMSITIVILTVVFFICNTTYVKVVSMDAFWMEMNESITNNFILLISSNHLMYLNSAITPVILIVRGKTMRKFLTNRLSSSRHDIKGTSSLATKDKLGQRSIEYKGWGDAGQLSFHVSAFLNVILTVVRSIMLFIPLCQVRRTWIVTAIIAYSLLWAILILTEWFYTYSHFLTRYDRAVLEILYSYPRPPGAVVDEVIRQIGGDKESLHFRRGAIWFTCVFLPYALPSLITLASGGAQIGRIFCRVKSTGKNHGKSQERARKMSITIVILTVVFFICNTTYVKVVSMDAFWMEMNESITNNFILLISSNHLMYLNSAITPVILIVRGKTMRKFLTNRLSSSRHDIKGTSSLATKEIKCSATHDITSLTSATFKKMKCAHSFVHQ